MTQTPVPSTATIVQGQLNENSAQIVVDKGIFMANRAGSGMVLDGPIIEIGAEDIRLTPSKSIEIWGSPLNNKLVYSETHADEFASAARLNCYAGEVLYGMDVPHSHRYPSIKVPSVYKSRTLQTLKKIEKASSVIASIGGALAGPAEAIIDGVVGQATAKATKEVSKIIEENIPELDRFTSNLGENLPSIPLGWEELLKDTIIKVVKEYLGESSGLF